MSDEPQATEQSRAEAETAFDRIVESPIPLMIVGPIMCAVTGLCIGLAIVIPLAIVKFVYWLAG